MCQLLVYPRVAHRDVSLQYQEGLNEYFTLSRCLSLSRSLRIGIAPYPRAGGTWLPLGNPSPADRAQQPVMPVLQLVL